MLERLTPGTRAMVIDAQARARAMGHGFVGDEHLLLAAAASESVAGDALRACGLTPAALEPVVRRPGSPAAIDREALASIGIDLDVVIARIEAVFGPGALAPPTRRGRRRRPACHDDQPRGHLRFTARAKECLELALIEMRGRHDGAVDVVHLVLALTALAGGPAHDAMAALGVSSQQVRTTVLDRYRRAG
ncbi:MAG: Clp protease N-terminal domain-containing protein [Frankiaceae bacterium]